MSDRLDAYFEYVAAISRPVLRAWIATTEPEFCAAVEDAVHDALAQIESGASQYWKLEERGLSLLLTQLLASATFPAVAESYNNGHVDVAVHHPAALPFTVLGECKIYRGYQHHHDGCRQLLDRYATGRFGRAFCLDFFQVPSMYSKLERLRADFDKQRPLKQIDLAKDHRIKGAFVTIHEHFAAAPVQVLHLGCNVYHPSSMDR